MGVVYKLKPEIKNWLLEKKRAHPALSCRGLVSLIEEEFKIRVSKSSINSLFKEAGLSMPVGRRQKKRRRKFPLSGFTQETGGKMELPLALMGPQAEKLLPAPPPASEAPKEIPPALQPERVGEIPEQIPAEMLQKIHSSGVILLKATDYLIGGSYHICEIIRRRLNLKDEHLLAKIESLIYAPFLEVLGVPLSLYLNELKSAAALIPEILRTLSRLFTAVRCIKVLLSNGENLYLDGQWHTVWSVPHIPYDFVNTVSNIKSYLKRAFSEEEPFVLFTAPGYDRPTAEFYNFILSLGYRAPKIAGVGLCGNNLREIEFIHVGQDKKYFLIFGLWPWQFTEYRRVKKIGDFKPFYFQAQGKSFYLADIALELRGFDKNSKLLLSGCALKNNPSEKTRLMLITNLPEGSVQSEYLASLYLSHWPNLEEAFQDFSRKVELFTYTADSQQLFSLETINLERELSDIEHLFNYYLRVLDLYFKRHFLPSGYIDKDFSALKEEFYQVKVNIAPLKNYSLVTFQPPPDSACLKALEYACRRLNEREITLSDHQRLWFCL